MARKPPVVPIADGDAVMAQGMVGDAPLDERPILAPARVAPGAFDVAFNVIKVLPHYWNQDAEAVKRAARLWQDEGIVPIGLDA